MFFPIVKLLSYWDFWGTDAFALSRSSQL